MNKKSLFLMILLFLCIDVYCLSPEEEYDFLIKDLYNYSTHAYKRTFDFETDKSEGIINLSQGNVQVTNLYLDIAILSNGFFKVKDEQGNVYYTRFGELRYDSESCSLYILVGNSKFFLDLKPLPKYVFVSDEIRIRRDGSVECVIPEEKSNGNDGLIKSMSGIFELKNGLSGKTGIDDERIDEIIKEQKKEEKKEIIDKIILYNIEETDIDFYDGYLIKTKNSPDVISTPHFEIGVLEMSNVLIDKVLIRMLFVIEKLDDSKIKQKEIKKYLIQKMLDPDFIRVKLFGYFYEEHPNLNDISGLKEYVHFLERAYE
ncbi:MAG: hypothetical protein IKR40_09105 [Treponema sp.]|nr:hypothetical protein [Treponema sp.]